MKKFVVNINSTLDAFHSYLFDLKVKNILIPLFLSGLFSGLVLGIVAFTERVTAYGMGLGLINKLQVLSSSICLISTFGIFIDALIFLAILISIYLFLGFTRLTKEKGNVSPYKVLILYSIIAAAICTFGFIHLFLQVSDNALAVFFQRPEVLIKVLYVLVVVIVVTSCFLIFLIKRKYFNNYLRESKKLLIILFVGAIAIWSVLIFLYSEVASNSFLICFYFARQIVLFTNYLWPKIISLYVNNLYVFDACLFVILSVLFVAISHLLVFVIKKLLEFKYFLAIVGALLFLLFVLLYLLSQNMYSNQLFFNFAMSLILIGVASTAFIFLNSILLIIYHYYKKPVEAVVSTKIKYRYLVLFYVILSVLAFWGLKTSNATKAFIFRHCTYQKTVLDWPKLFDLNKSVVVYPPCKKVLVNGEDTKGLKQKLKRKPNIFFITIDTLGGKATNDFIRDNKGSTISKFSKGSYNFVNAYSPAPYTYASFSATFASKYLAHMADIDFPTLPQILALNGYRTASFISLSPFNEKGSVTLNPKNYPLVFNRDGVSTDKSFKTVSLKNYKNFIGMFLVTLGDKCYPSLMSKGYNENIRPVIKDYNFQKDNLITAKYLNYLDNYNGDRPLFVWLHYSQLHLVPPSIIFECLLSNNEFKKAYMYNLGVVDINLKKDFDALKQLGIFDNSIIILTSDHGESAKEHGNFFHVYSTYNEYNYIPLMIKLPGENKPKIINKPVSLLDITPTILNYLGYNYKNFDYSGRSLLKSMENVDNKKRSVFSILYMYKSSNNFSYNLTGFDNCYDKTELEIAIVDENNEWKLIDNKYFNFRELYNLRKDPGERNNLIDQNPEKARQLLQQIHNTLFLKK